MQNPPLAQLLRPKKLSSFVGQEKLVGKNGIIKKTPLKDFENVRKNGIIAIGLKKINFSHPLFFGDHPGQAKQRLLVLLQTP